MAGSDQGAVLTALEYVSSRTYRWGVRDCITMLEDVLGFDDLRPGWCVPSHARSIAAARHRYGSVERAYREVLLEHGCTLSDGVPGASGPYTAAAGAELAPIVVGGGGWWSVCVDHSRTVTLPKRAGAVLGVREAHEGVSRNLLFATDGPWVVVGGDITHFEVAPWLG